MNSHPKAEKNYRLIVFDWDGTIIDSVPKMIGCYRRAFEILDLPTPDPSVLRRAAGRGWHFAVPALVPGCDRTLYQDITEIYGQVWRHGDLPEPGAIEGAEALLRELRQRGYLLALATRRSLPSIERISQTFGLRDCFDTVRGDDGVRPKPDPATLHSILEELDVPAEQVLMVGDTDLDIQMALRAGVDACGVTSGGVLREEFAELGAHFVLTDITGLREFLPARPAAPAGGGSRPGPTPTSGDPHVRMTDREGAVWLAKAVLDPSRLLLEYVVFNGYRALGLLASECRLPHEVPLADGNLPDPSGNVLFVRAADLVDMQDVLRDASADRQAEVKQKAARGFAADCLFANQAVFSSPLASFKMDGQGEIWRTTVDTTLDLAQDGDIGMIDAARDGDAWPQAAFFFGELHKRDLIAQIDHIEAHRNRLLPEVDPPNRALAARIGALLSRRIDLLVAYRSRLLEERSAYLAEIQRSLQDPRRAVVFDKGFDSGGLDLNGIPFGESSPYMPGPVEVEEPPFQLERGLQPAAGIVVVESDNRVWIYEPHDHHGSHQNAFPKGQVEGESSQLEDLHRTAVRETWEETGIHARIIGYLADTSFFGYKNRYYLGERIGGDPCQAHWEAARVKLVPMADLHRFVNVQNDRAVLRLLLSHFGKPLHRPEIATIVDEPRAHRWQGIQGGLTTAGRETAGITRGCWFEDEGGAQWFMKQDRHIQGLQTSAEVVGARIYDFFGYRVPEIQKMVVGDTHLVFSKDVGPVRDITDFTGLDHPDIRRLRVIAAYLADWGRISNAMDNLVTADGRLVLIDFGSTLGARSWGRLKPGPIFSPAVGYFAATRDFWVFFDEYAAGADSSHPWGRLTAADLPPLIARFEALRDDVIDEIVAAAQYPTEADARQVARALKWRRDAVIAGAADYFSGQSARMGKTPGRKTTIERVADRTSSPSLGRIAELLVEDPTAIGFDPAIQAMSFKVEGVSIPVAALLQHMERELPAIETAEQITVSPATLKRHWRNFLTADMDVRYLINISGLYETYRMGNATDFGVAGDAMSLRLYTSYLFYPMNALFRLDFNETASVLALRGMYQVAARNFSRVLGTNWSPRLGQNMIRLYDFAASITSREDENLCRLVREQILHNIMAARALLRQTPLDSGLHPRLYRIADLEEDALTRYRKALAEPPGSPGQVISEGAFTSTSVDESRSELYSRRDKKYKFVITPLREGSRGRYLNGKVDSVTSNSELEVLYPPGSSFRVTRIEADVAGDTNRTGELRTHLFLEETAPRRR
jgi:phosphoglycolate phosphatase